VPGAGGSRPRGRALTRRHRRRPEGRHTCSTTPNSAD
jgi:hypothetical protein